MGLNILEDEIEEDEYTIVEEREILMIPPNSDGKLTLRKAHFLKPLLNPKIQPLPKSPSVPLRSNPKINIEDLGKSVSFYGRLKPLKGLRSWVDDLKQTHQSIWKKVGIFDAIAASSYKIKRDNELIMCLAERWCPETNTFVFPWGESTISLEDIMVLGGFPVLGASPVLIPFDKNDKNAELYGELRNSYSLIQRNSGSHSRWIEYYKGMGGEIEHVAFLVLWLSRYVYSTNYYGRINYKVFGVAISVAMGTKIAFASTILASIYRDLSLLKEKIVSCTMEGVDDGLDLVIWGPFQLVQLWAWERFLELSPKPMNLVKGEPRVARWHNVTKLKTQNLRLEIESAADSFVWRPYALCLNNWLFPKFYSDDGMWVLIDSEVDEDLLSFVRCLRPSELVGFDCVMQYLPHRVGLQFGMDQDIPNLVARSNGDMELAWSSYAKPLEGLKLYLPPRLFEGDVTVQYSKWLRPELDVDNDTLLTFVRRKRSDRKINKVSKVLLERGTKSFEGNGTEDTRVCDHTCVEEDNEEKVEENYMITNGGRKCLDDTHTQNTGPETKRLCCVLAEDNHLEKAHISPADVEQGKEDGRHIVVESFDLESRISFYVQRS
ncbi:uncharacterized protein [Spinacia oleracea]|uniref:Aminotransferase-like plant mobile domain-containing protein n=1 Tax=Spinacia oleracea TaxID=3562 RepID=A0A9R0JIL0_SPIOL|nr:uncharacterized protein LOC110805929 [Spinacia oleracea]